MWDYLYNFEVEKAIPNIQSQNVKFRCLKYTHNKMACSNW